MDKLIYTAMAGAKQTMLQQATVANNLANAATTGFRAQINSLRAVPVQGEGLATRTLVLDASVGSSFAQGALQHTGRELDVAIEGPGWIAVQRADGTEAYTRSGSLRLGPNGQLQTREGLAVLGDGGPIAIPSNARVTIAADGSISAANPAQPDAPAPVVGRIKLARPDEARMTRGADGLFNAGGAAQSDDSVRLVSGALESSNVNVIEAVVQMIGLARQFDMQVKLLQNAESNDRQASQLLALNR